MRRVVFEFAFVLSFLASLAQTALAQNAPAPTQPTRPNPSAPRQPPPTPQRPAPGGIPGSGSSVVATQANPNLAPATPMGAFSNQVSDLPGVPSPAELNQVESQLVALQGNIEQLLPIIASLDNLPITGVAVNRNALTQAGVVNPQQPGFFGTVGTNVFAMNGNTRQQLLVLQTELTRALIALRQLNGVNLQDFSGVSNAAPGSFVSRFVLVTNAANPNQRILMPTGR
jgi:hypothetical protein